mmetsp:Transcript_1901/g.2659  ORF Transcript_1901/g.2659 Transcript_1901/m.2659 type:complete len:80 (+) Transcript_1901:968-1207(+)
MVGNSLDQVNLMQNDSGLGNSHPQNPLSAGHNSGPLSGSVQQVVQLNKKIMGKRKRNGREQSYDSYNQKLQLPPMIKTP